MNSLKTGYEDFPQYGNILGIDECGYGAGAGPLVISGVILPEYFSSPLMRDSKKLSEPKRREAVELINSVKVDSFIAHVSAKYINEHGVSKSMEECMRQITEHFKDKADFILMDGNKWFGNTNIPHKTVIKGDDTYQCIAAASLIGKVKRDDYMVEVSKKHPNYGFESNKGYLTESHRNGILNFGSTQYHRTQYVESWLKKRK